MLRNLIKSVVFAAATLAALPVRAEMPQPADISELISMFSELCINDFPNADSMSAFFSKHSAVEMAPAEVREYLKNDPGQAWYIKTSVALYAVTIERPPYHTCGIRRMTRSGPDKSGISAAVATDKAYASGVGGNMVGIPSKHVSGPGGLDITAAGISVSLNGAQSDLFGIFITDYHGRAPRPWTEYATPGTGVEVRLTRQVIGRTS